jgi:hypothetical protein
VKQIQTTINKQKQYTMEDGLLLRKQNPPLPAVPFVPQGRIRADILKIYHDTPGNGAHFGRDKTIRRIQERYYWPTMIADIENHVKSCLPCAQNNHRRQKPPGKLQPIPPPPGIWKLLSMDFHGPINPTTRRGNRYIISLTDVLSKGGVSNYDYSVPKNLGLILLSLESALIPDYFPQVYFVF